MKKLICVALLTVCVGLTQGDTIVSQLGDEDGFGSYQPGIDDLTRSEMIETLLTINLGIVEMDIYYENWPKGWTHYFSIPEGHTVLSANLRIGVVESGEHHWNVHQLREIYRIDESSIILDSHLPSGWNAGPSVMIQQQPGYIRPAPMETVEFNLDLANVIFNPDWGDMVNPTFVGPVINDLYDGEFNIWGLPDNGVDYSILTIETIPEPLSSSLLLVGSSLFLLRRKKYKL